MKVSPFVFEKKNFSLSQLVAFPLLLLLDEAVRKVFAPILYGIAFPMDPLSHFQTWEGSYFVLLNKFTPRDRP